MALTVGERQARREHTVERRDGRPWPDRDSMTGVGGDLPHHGGRANAEWNVYGLAIGDGNGAIPTAAHD